jgi:hypothetical protein
MQNFISTFLKLLYSIFYIFEKTGAALSFIHQGSTSYFRITEMFTSHDLVNFRSNIKQITMMKNCTMYSNEETCLYPREKKPAQH